MKLTELTPFKLSWNSINGFAFELLGIELMGKSSGFEGSLLAMYINSDFIQINIFYIWIKIELPII